MEVLLDVLLDFDDGEVDLIEKIGDFLDVFEEHNDFEVFNSNVGRLLFNFVLLHFGLLGDDFDIEVLIEFLNEVLKLALLVRPGVHRDVFDHEFGLIFNLEVNIFDQNLAKKLHLVDKVDLKGLDCCPYLQVLVLLVFADVLLAHGFCYASLVV